jgi:hypothetical protein
MSSGWFMLHRKIIHSPVFDNPELLRVWLYLLARASYKRRSTWMSTAKGKTLIELDAGQLIVGRTSTAEKLDLKPSTFRNHMRRLQTMGMVAVAAKATHTVVTITNWRQYQDRHRTATGEAKRTRKRRGHDEPGQPKDSLGTGKGQPEDTYKKDEKLENGKNQHSTTTSAEDAIQLQSMVGAMAATIATKRRRPVDEHEWQELTYAAYVGIRHGGQSTVDHWVRNAKRKSELTAGYFVAAAIKTATGHGEDFDELKRSTPAIPYEPPVLQPRVDDSEFEAIRGDVVRDHRRRGVELTEVEADKLARETLVARNRKTRGQRAIESLGLGPAHQ